MDLAKDGAWETVLKEFPEIQVERIQSDGVYFRLFGKEFFLYTRRLVNPEGRPYILVRDDQEIDHPHVLLKSFSFPTNDKEHAETRYRSVCLYQEGIIVWFIMSAIEKVRDILSRLTRLFSMNSREQEYEFQKEFTYYWRQASKGRFVSIFLSQEDLCTLLNRWINKRKAYYAAPDMQYLRHMDRDAGWRHDVGVDAVYIPISDPRGILPPHKKYKWTPATIQEIVSAWKIAHITDDTYQYLKDTSVSSNRLLLVLGMKLGEQKIFCGIRLQCKSKGRKSLLEKLTEDVQQIEYVNVDRLDYRWLCEQNGNDYALTDKKVLLIGAGSLGSYVAMELAKTGVRNLTIYDGDVLEPVNTVRWADGSQGIRANKARLLERMLKAQYPELQVKGVESAIDSINLLKEAVSSADWVISTIGSSDRQLWFNRLLSEMDKAPQTFYIWLEAGGEHSHILVVDYAKKGCFQCLFTGGDGAHINNKANKSSMIMQENTIMSNGCGGVRAAYGTAPILRTVAAFLEVLKELSKGTMTRNMLIDIDSRQVIYHQESVYNAHCEVCRRREKKNNNIYQNDERQD